MIRALIVEDEPPIARDTAMQIRCSNIRFQAVHLALNGKEALRYLVENPVDVIFTDVRMPVMDGIALVAELAVNYPEIPVVVISGYADYEYTRQAINCHVFDYLLKPLNKDEIRSVVARLTEHLRLRREACQRENLQRLLLGSSEELPDPMPAGIHWYVAVVSFGIYPVFSINQGEQPVFPKEVEAELPGIIAREDVPDDVCHVLNGQLLSEKILLFSRPLTPESLLSALSGKGAGLTPKLLPRLCVYSEAVRTEKLCEAVSICRYYLRENIVCGRTLAAAVGPGKHRHGTSPVEPNAQHGQEEAVACIHSALLRRKYDPYYEGLQSLFRLLPDCSARSIYNILSELAHASMSAIGKQPNDYRRLEIDIVIDRNILTAGNMERLFMQTLQVFDAFLGWKDVEALGTRSANQYVETIKAYLDANYLRQITNQDLAETFSLDPSYIGRLYKQKYGISPLKYLLELKVERAKQMIADDPEIRLKVIADCLGYSDVLYFSKVFKKKTGYYPSDYKTMLTIRKNG